MAKPHVSLADRKAPASAVVSVVFLRLCIEVLLGTYTKAVYRLQPNPAINLVFTNITMLLLSVLFHLLNKAVPIMPAAFGGQWSKPQWGAVKGLLFPTLCLCGSILLKQNIIKNSGPGYAEMIAGVAVPISATIQYFVNGVTIGYLGIASCLVAFTCYAACFPVCGASELVGGLGAAALNVTRASFTKKSNKDHKLSPGLNLVYTCLLGLPFYVVMALVGEYLWFEYDPLYNWRNLFFWVGPIPLPVGTFFIQMFMAFCSNIVVFVLYDIASPLTYVISAGLKGIVQTFFDIFYVDYYVILLIKKMIPSADFDAEKYKNKKVMTKMGLFAFIMKLLYFFLYVLEKILAKRKKDKEEKVKSQELAAPVAGK